MLCGDRTIAPHELAQEAEARGFESLFLPEHTHIPVARTTPYPGGEPLPEELARLHDPFVALAAAAAVTTRLRLGTGVCLVVERDPIVLAKEVASLDVLSGGRFVFGVGFGWNAEEMADHGADPSKRRAITREKLLAMKALWAEDEASFTGEHVQFPPSWSWPKPVQRPHPPVLLGGQAGEGLFRHVAEWADGWIPFGGAGVREQLPRLHAAAEAAGRDPDSIRLTIFGARPDPEALEHYASMGVDRTVLALRPAPRDQTLPALDRRAPLIERLIAG